MSSNRLTASLGVTAHRILLLKRGNIAMLDP